LKIGGKTKTAKKYSLGTVSFDLKEAVQFSWAGQNARTKSIIKPKLKNDTKTLTKPLIIIFALSDGILHWVGLSHYDKRNHTN